MTGCKLQDDGHPCACGGLKVDCENRIAGPDLALLRGEVARAIEPSAWAWNDLPAIPGDHPAADGAHERTVASLAKADAILSLLSPYLMGEGFDEAPAKGAAARRSHQDTLTSGRSAKDFAIEFGGYLATDATRLLDLFGQHPIVQDTMPYEAYETLCDHIQGLRSAVYEFEKRRDRALSAFAPRRPVVDEGAWQPIETAPKDGSEPAPFDGEPVLISDGAYVEAAFWNLSRRSGACDRRYPWTILDETNGVNGRVAEGSGSPTKWRPMPLPAAPSAEATDSGNGAAGDAAASSLPDASSGPAPASEEGE